MEVNIHNRVGTIIAVTNRMVRVDFNRRFAGASLKYEFTVLDMVEGDEDKVMAICEMDYGTNEGFRATITADKVVLYLPDVCKYDQKWLLTKYKIVADLREAFEGVTVELVEEYLKKEDKPGPPRTPRKRRLQKSSEALPRNILNNLSSNQPNAGAGGLVWIWRQPPKLQVGGSNPPPPALFLSWQTSEMDD